MNFTATVADRMLLALVANGGVDISCEPGLAAPEPRPSNGGEFAPIVQERLTLLLRARLLESRDCGRAQLTLEGVDVLRGKR